jgi:hypothetical protein
MDLTMIATRIAADYDFQTKMKINALVLEETTRESGYDRSRINDIAKKLSESDIHQNIQNLADFIHEEAERISKEGLSRAASCVNIITAAKKKKPKRRSRSAFEPEDPQYSCRLELSFSVDFTGDTSSAELVRKLKKEVKDAVESVVNMTARDLHLEYESAVVEPIKIDCAVVDD